ncbi:F-box only protein 2-like [Misgurnus anguillicaudatus]|uniref:F-box only protein 2-like n=1 Tax=Misgurnus anguillicaudatus TaxID=75329 RepID=UPI003CCFCBA6
MDPSASNQNDVSKKLEFGSVPCPRLNSAVVEEILLNLPAKDVVLKCRLVCREWKELVDTEAHWKERCRREGIDHHVALRSPADWRWFYFRYKHRLLQNPREEYVTKVVYGCRGPITIYCRIQPRDRRWEELPSQVGGAYAASRRGLRRRWDDGE